jgi:hypothetical protein
LQKVSNTRKHEKVQRNLKQAVNKVLLNCSFPKQKLFIYSFYVES